MGLRQRCLWPDTRLPVHVAHKACSCLSASAPGSPRHPQNQRRFHIAALAKRHWSDDRFDRLPSFEPTPLRAGQGLVFAAMNKLY